LRPAAGPDAPLRHRNHGGDGPGSRHGALSAHVRESCRYSEAAGRRQVDRGGRMTLRTNARLAGFTFLFYIAAGISSMALAGRTQATDVLTLCTSFSALVLAVTLYAITREQDPDLALLAMACRVIESIPGRDGEVFFAVGSLLFCWLLLRGRMIALR